MNSTGYCYIGWIYFLTMMNAASEFARQANKKLLAQHVLRCEKCQQAERAEVEMDVEQRR